MYTGVSVILYPSWSAIDPTSDIKYFLSHENQKSMLLVYFVIICVLVNFQNCRYNFCLLPSFLC